MDDQATARPAAGADGQPDQNGGVDPQCTGGGPCTGGGNGVRPAALTDQESGGTPPGAGQPDPTTGGTTPAKPVDGQPTDSSGPCAGGGGTGCADGGARVAVALNPDQRGGTTPGVRVAVDSSSQTGPCQGSVPCAPDGARRPGIPGVSGGGPGTALAAGQSRAGQTDDPAGRPRIPLMFGGNDGPSTGAATTTCTSDGQGQRSGQCGAGGDCTPGQHPAVPAGPSSATGGQGGQSNTGGGSEATVHTGQDSTDESARAQLAGAPQDDPNAGERSSVSERGPPAAPDGHSEASPDTSETRVRAMADTHAQANQSTNATTSVRTVAAKTDTVVPAVDQQTRANQDSKDSTTAPAVDDRETPLPEQPGTPGQPGEHAAPVGRALTVGVSDAPVDGTGKVPLMFQGANKGGSSDRGANTGTALDSLGGNGTQKPCTGDTCHGQPSPAAPAPGPNSGGQSNMGGGQGGNGHGGGQLATEHGTPTPVQPGARPGADYVQRASDDPRRSPGQPRGPPAIQLSQQRNTTAQTMANIKSAAPRPATGTGGQQQTPEQSQAEPVVKLVSQQVTTDQQQGAQPRRPHGVVATRQPNGDVLVSFDDVDQHRDFTCPAPCRSFDENGFGGQRARTTDQGIEVSNPSVDGRPLDVCTGKGGCNLRRDEDGKGDWGVLGPGEVRDGVSGSHLTFPGGNYNGGRLGGPEGSPFTSSYAGGAHGDISNPDIGKGKWTDHVDLAGGTGTLKGRDGDGHAGDYSHTGQGVVTVQVGEHGKDVVTSDGNGLKGADAHSTVTTPDAVTGAPSSYQVGQGQTGNVQLANGKRIDLTEPSGIKTRTVDDGTAEVPTPSGASMRIPLSHQVSFPEGENNGITVVGSDARGQGGSIDCHGVCHETGPRVSPDLANTNNSAVWMHDEFGGPNSRTSNGIPTPNGYHSIYLEGDGRADNITPAGDAAHCVGQGCGYLQANRDANGNGGFGFCFGAGGSCTMRTTSADGQQPKTLTCAQATCRPSVLLYPNKTDIDKNGPNVGWACGMGAGGNGCTGGAPDEHLQGRGQTDPSAMSLFTTGYTRPAQNTRVDKQLAEDLAQFGVKEGDALPPLTPQAFQQLREQDPGAADRYLASLPPLSLADNAFTAARAAGAESNLQYVKNGGNAELPGLNGILDKIEKTGSTAGLTKQERALWNTARKRFPRLAVDRGIVDGLNQIQATDPYIDQRARDGAAGFQDPGRELNGDGKAPGLRARMGLDDKGQQLDGQGRIIVSSDEQARWLQANGKTEGRDYVKLTPEQQAQQSASSVASLSMVGHEEELLQRRGQIPGLDDRVSALEEKSNGKLTPAEAARLNAESDRINQAIDPNDEQGKINRTQEFLKEQARTLPGGQQNLEAPRPDDIKDAHAYGETAMADQLKAWNDFGQRAKTVADNLRKAGNTNLADQVDARLAGTAGFNYETVRDDLGSRSPDTKMVAPALLPGTTPDKDQGDPANLRLIQLPSTGRPDMIHVLNSVANSPGYQNYPADSLIGQVYRAQSPDEIAHLASLGTAQEMQGRISNVVALNSQPDAKETVEGLLVQQNTDQNGQVNQENVDRALAALQAKAGNDLNNGAEVALINGFQVDPNHPDQIGPAPLYRVTDAAGNVTLIDSAGGVFSGLTEYQQGSELHTDGHLLLPRNFMTVKAGFEDNTFEQVAAHQDSTWQTVGKWGARGALVVGTGALLVSGVGTLAGVGLMSAEFAAAAGVAADTAAFLGSAANFSFAAGAAIAGATAGYDQYQRAQHNQSISLSDPVGRSNWITMGSTLFLGAGKAFGMLGGASSKMVGRLGSTLGVRGQAGMRVAGKAATTLGAAGYGGQYLGSEIEGIRNWDNMSPAQKTEFKIDTAVGVGAFLAGGFKGSVAARGVRPMMRNLKGTVGDNFRGARSDLATVIGRSLEARVRTESAPPLAKVQSTPALPVEEGNPISPGESVRERELRPAEGSARPGRREAPEEADPARRTEAANERAPRVNPEREGLRAGGERAEVRNGSRTFEVNSRGEAQEVQRGPNRAFEVNSRGEAQEVQRGGTENTNQARTANEARSTNSTRPSNETDGQQQNPGGNVPAPTGQSQDANARQGGNWAQRLSNRLFGRNRTQQQAPGGDVPAPTGQAQGTRTQGGGGAEGNGSEGSGSERNGSERNGRLGGGTRGGGIRGGGTESGGTQGGGTRGGGTRGGGTQRGVSDPVPNPNGLRQGGNNGSGNNGSNGGPDKRGSNDGRGSTKSNEPRGGRGEFEVSASDTGGGSGSGAGHTGPERSGVGGLLGKVGNRIKRGFPSKLFRGRTASGTSPPSGEATSDTASASENGRASEPGVAGDGTSQTTTRGTRDSEVPARNEPPEHDQTGKERPDPTRNSTDNPADRASTAGRDTGSERGAGHPAEYDSAGTEVAEVESGPGPGSSEVGPSDQPARRGGWWSRLRATWGGATRQRPNPEYRDAAEVQSELELANDGIFEPVDSLEPSRLGLEVDEHMVDTPVGTVVVVRVRERGGQSSRFIYGVKARRGVRYYDGTRVRRLAPPDTEMFLVRGEDTPRGVESARRVQADLDDLAGKAQAKTREADAARAKLAALKDDPTASAAELARAQRLETNVTSEERAAWGKVHAARLNVADADAGAKPAGHGQAGHDQARASEADTGETTVETGETGRDADTAGAEGEQPSSADLEAAARKDAADRANADIGKVKDRAEKRKRAAKDRTNKATKSWKHKTEARKWAARDRKWATADREQATADLKKATGGREQATAKRRGAEAATKVFRNKLRVVRMRAAMRATASWPARARRSLARVDTAWARLRNSDKKEDKVARDERLDAEIAKAMEELPESLRRRLETAEEELNSARQAEKDAIQAEKDAKQFEEIKRRGEEAAKQFEEIKRQGEESAKRAEESAKRAEESARELQKRVEASAEAEKEAAGLTARFRRLGAKWWKLESHRGRGAGPDRGEADSVGAKEVNEEGGHTGADGPHARDFEAEQKKLAKEMDQVLAQLGEVLEKQATLDRQTATERIRELRREWEGSADQQRRKEIEQQWFEGWKKLRDAGDLNAEAQMMKKAAGHTESLDEWLKKNHGKNLEAIKNLRDQLHDSDALYENFLKRREELSLVERYALAFEANVRVGDGRKPYDVQIAALLELDRESAVTERSPERVLIEMLTGEGKEFVGQLWTVTRPAGTKVNVITHNHQLAKDAFELVDKIGKELGLTVRLREQDQIAAEGERLVSETPDGAISVPPSDWRQTYEADVVYLAVDEAVRDLQLSEREGHPLAGRDVLMDEVDMLAIDLGRTAWRIGEQVLGTQDHARMHQIAELAKKVELGSDVTLTGRRGRVRVKITPAGRRTIQNFVEEMKGVPLTRREKQQLNDALRARIEHPKDRDHIVDGNKTPPVNHATGQSYGLVRYFNHQWLDALARVTIKPGLTSASQMTMRDYLDAQNSVRGMTGTAKASEKAFKDIYGMDVVQLPTNKPRQLVELPPLLYRTHEQAITSVIDEIKAARQQGDLRPWILFRADVADAESLQARLNSELDIEVGLIDAKTTPTEDRLTQAEAARPGAVTVVTAKFGRGNDPKLGGDPNFVENALAIADKVLLMGQGGGHAEILDMFDSARVIAQMGGRVGRNGMPGTYRMRVGLDHTKLSKINGADRQWLNSIAHGRHGEVGLLTEEERQRANKIIDDVQRDLENRANNEVEKIQNGKSRPEYVLDQAVGASKSTPAGRLASRRGPGAEARASAKRVERAQVRRDRTLADLDKASRAVEDGNRDQRHLGILGVRCESLCAAQQELDSALRAYRNLAVPTFEPAGTIEKNSDPAAGARTEQSSVDIAGGTAKEELALSPATADDVRKLVEAGDIDGAISLVQWIADGAAAVDAITGHGWGGAEWTISGARHVLAMLHRVRLEQRASKALDAAEGSILTEKPQRASFDRLAALLSTLPDEAASKTAATLIERQRTVIRAATQSRQLAEDLKMGDEELAATLALAQALHRQATEGEQNTEPVPAGSRAVTDENEPRVAALSADELAVLLAYANGRSPDEIAAQHDNLTPKRVESILGGVPNKLGANGPGRGVRIQRPARAALGDTETAADVERHLRQIEDGDELHPLERQLFWNRADRIENLVTELPEPNRDELYRWLRSHKIESITQLYEMHSDELAALGLTTNQVDMLWQAKHEAAREVGEPQQSGPVAPDAARRAEGLDVLRALSGQPRPGTHIRELDQPHGDLGPEHVRVLAALAGLAPIDLPGAVDPVVRSTALRALDALVRSGHGPPSSQESLEAKTEQSSGKKTPTSERPPAGGPLGQGGRGSSSGSHAAKPREPGPVNPAAGPDNPARNGQNPDADRTRVTGGRSRRGVRRAGAAFAGVAIAIAGGGTEALAGLPLGATLIPSTLVTGLVTVARRPGRGGATIRGPPPGIVALTAAANLPTVVAAGLFTASTFGTLALAAGALVGVTLAALAITPADQSADRSDGPVEKPLDEARPDTLEQKLTHYTERENYWTELADRHRRAANQVRRDNAGVLRQADLPVTPRHRDRRFRRSYRIEAIRARRLIDEHLGLADRASTQAAEYRGLREKTEKEAGKGVNKDPTVLGSAASAFVPPGWFTGGRGYRQPSRPSRAERPGSSGPSAGAGASRPAGEQGGKWDGLPAGLGGAGDAGGGVRVAGGSAGLSARPVEARARSPPARLRRPRTDRATGRTTSSSPALSPDGPAGPADIAAGASGSDRIEPTRAAHIGQRARGPPLWRRPAARAGSLIRDGYRWVKATRLRRIVAGAAVIGVIVVVAALTESWWSLGGAAGVFSWPLGSGDDPRTSEWRARFQFDEPDGRDLTKVRHAVAAIHSAVVTRRATDQRPAPIANVDQELLDRLGRRGINPAPAGQAGAYGPAILHVLDALADPNRGGYTARDAVWILDRAVQGRLLAALHQVVGDERLGYPRSFKRFIGAFNAPGVRRQLEEAAKRTRDGHQIVLDGIYFGEDGSGPYGGDIIDVTVGEVIQMKTLRTSRDLGIREMFDHAIEQLSRDAGEETPPPGFQRVVHLHFEEGAYGNLAYGSRGEVRQTLRMLNVTPGLRRTDGHGEPIVHKVVVTNQAATTDDQAARYEFRPEELRQGAGAALWGVFRGDQEQRLVARLPGGFFSRYGRGLLSAGAGGLVGFVLTSAFGWVGAAAVGAEVGGVVALAGLVWAPRVGRGHGVRKAAWGWSERGPPWTVWFRVGLAVGAVVGLLVGPAAVFAGTAMAIVPVRSGIFRRADATRSGRASRFGARAVAIALMGLVSLPTAVGLGMGGHAITPGDRGPAVEGPARPGPVIGIDASRIELVASRGPTSMSTAVPTRITVLAAGRVWVRPGDTLSRLAAAFGVQVGDFMAANPTLRNPNLIRAGSQLTTPAHWEGRYRIQPGDTLSEIAARFGLSVDALVEANPGRFPTLERRNHISPRGPPLVIPGHAAPRAGPTTIPAPPGTTTTPAPPQEQTPGTAPAPGATAAPATGVPAWATAIAYGLVMLGAGLGLVIIEHRAKVGGWFGRLPGQVGDGLRIGGPRLAGTLGALGRRVAALGRTTTGPAALPWTARMAFVLGVVTGALRYRLGQLRAKMRDRLDTLPRRLPNLAGQVNNGVRGWFGELPGRLHKLPGQVHGWLRVGGHWVVGTLRALRHGAAGLAGWDQPMPPGRGRTVLGTLAVAGLALGAGLLVVGSTPLAAALGIDTVIELGFRHGVGLAVIGSGAIGAALTLAAITSSAVAGARVVWSSDQPRQWLLPVIAGVTVMVAAVLLGLTSPVALPLWIGAAAQFVRGMVLVFRDDTRWGAALSKRTAKASVHAVARLGVLLFVTRLVSVETNAAATQFTSMAVWFGLTSVAAWATWAAVGTWIAHGATGIRNEATAVSKGFSGKDGLGNHRQMLKRWSYVGLAGYAFTWFGNFAALVSMALQTEGNPAVVPFGEIISMTTLASISWGVLYLNWHFFLEEVLGEKAPRRPRRPTHRHQRFGLLLHDLALTIYGLNALWGTSRPLFLGAAAVTAVALGLAVIFWLKAPRGPPGTPQDWRAFIYIALVNGLGIGAGWLAWHHTGGYEWTLASVMGIQVGFIAVTWSMDRLLTKILPTALRRRLLRLTHFGVSRRVVDDLHRLTLDRALTYSELRGMLRLGMSWFVEYQLPKVLPDARRKRLLHRRQLPRLTRAGAPGHIVDDLAALVDDGTLTHTDLNNLLRLGELRHIDRAMNRFAKNHDVHWTEPQRAALRVALRKLADQSRLTARNEEQDASKQREVHSGAVAIGGLSPAGQLLVARVLAALAPHPRPLEELPNRMPRGPPVFVLDLDIGQVPAVLAAAGFSDAEIAQALDALNRLVMFGWRTDEEAVLAVLPEAADGIGVITKAMGDELADHLATGRITPDEFDQWWAELLGHEVRFHLDDHPVTDEAEHTDDENRLADFVLTARTRGDRRWPG